MSKRLTRIVAVVVAVVMSFAPYPIIAAASTASASAPPPTHPSADPAGLATPLADRAAAAPGAFPTVRAGSNSAGPRFVQVAGQAGYEVPAPGTATVQTTVTVPSITCETGTDSSFGDVDTSDPSAGVALGFEDQLQVAANVLYNCQAQDYVGVFTIGPSCTAQFGRGNCYYQGFAGGAVSAGDQVEISASLSPSGSSVSITDLNSGATLSASAGGYPATGTSALIDATDFCFLPGGDSETCSVDDGSSPVPPPGYAQYNPFTFANSQVDGTALNSYITGAGATGSIELMNVWGTTLEGQTTPVDSTDTFTDTNAVLTLPTVTLSQPRVDQPSTQTGPVNLVFTATVSFFATTSYPIYLDYNTQDGTAYAGSNYDAESGTIAFTPGGSLSQNIDVPVIPGPEQGGPPGYLTMTLNLTNPSYVAYGTSGPGLINEGPIVTGVSPAVVPLDGGPDTALVVSGYNLSHVVSVQFCPTAAEGGGTCLNGIALSGQSENALTVEAPDATDDLPAGSPTLATDTIATDNQGVSSPADPSMDQLIFGCTQQVVTDGGWQVKGCLSDENNGVDISQDESYIDGVGVSSAPDAVTYETDSAEATSNAPASVALLLGSKAVTIFTGQLQAALSGNQPVTFSVPPKTQLAGLTISGTITLTPSSLGNASGSVTVTLPAVLGGGTGTLTFTTTTATGLSNLKIVVPKANLMQLFSLTGLTFEFKSAGNGGGTWSVKGKATTGGTQTATFSGSMTVSPTAGITAASLEVGALSLAGLVDISSLSLSLKSGVWSGSAAITQNTESGTEKASVGLTISNGVLSSASIMASNVPLFGVLMVSTFDMTYSGGNWSLNVSAAAAGSGGSAALMVNGGIITSASLNVSDLSFLGEFTVASAGISYSASGTNSACPDAGSGEIWCGNWVVQMPQATVVTGVDGTLAFDNGKYSEGSIGVSGSVPLFDGVFLTYLQGALHLMPPPTVISGTAGLSFGPTVNGSTLLSLTAQLTRVLSEGTTTGSYTAKGTISALGQELGNASIKVPDSGATTFNLTLGPSASTGLSYTKLGVTVQVTGQLDGSFSAGTFKLATGKSGVTVTVNGTAYTGTMSANNDGMAACAAAPSGKVGFEYIWSSGDTSVFGSTGCSERGL